LVNFQPITCIQMNKRKRDDLTAVQLQFKRKTSLNDLKHKLGIETFNLEKRIFRCRLSFKNQISCSTPSRKIHSFQPQTIQNRLLSDLMSFHNQDYDVGTIDFLYFNDGHQEQLRDYAIPRDSCIIVQYKALVIGFGFVQDQQMYFHVLHNGWSGFERYLEYFLKTLFL
jgi:hypothetical protein